MSTAKFTTLIKDVPHFPREGIVFKDITPLLEDAQAFKELIDLMAKSIPKETTKIVCMESRGFILGSALAYATSTGLVLCRKPGKLPRETYSGTYELEYGQDSLEVHKSSLSSKDQVVIVDDVLATGGTAKATIDLCQQAGAKVVGLEFVIELEFLSGRQKLKDFNVNSVQKY